MKAQDFFGNAGKDWPFKSYFSDDDPPWHWIRTIAAILECFFRENEPKKPPTIPPGVYIKGDVYLDPSVLLPPHAVICGPAYIGPHCEIRPGAFIRENVIVGAGCVLGNSCEYKNAILMGGVQTPHYNYVGDSILGHGSHLGAGAILSNFRFDQREIHVRDRNGNRISTGLQKLGACVGNFAEVGCNAVVLPGALLLPRSVIYPCCRFHGLLEEQAVFTGK